ncbi:MAG: hypothetical protein ACUVWA_07000 [Candidatus Oleimicrobiaceae bacterium]
MKAQRTRLPWRDSGVLQKRITRFLPRSIRLAAVIQAVIGPLQAW